MSYIKVKNNNHLVRDTESNCIINTNKSEYEQYLARKKHKQSEVNKVDNLERDVSTLRNQLQLELGVVEGWSAVIVGVGNLGSALAHYGGFKDKGFGVVGLFDDDPKKINSQVAGLVVKPISDLQDYCNKFNVAIGIIATPGEFAQDVADDLINCGVRSILNFAPVLLKNVKDVQIRSVDLSQELQILSYYLDRPILKAVD